MKKKGFTLAEVLITLGIVGVVAALTAPALVMNSRNQANAARLSVVMSNLENALTNAIATEAADNLYGTSLWNQTINAGSSDQAVQLFVGRLGQYMHVNGFNKSDAIYYGTIPTCAMSESGGTGTCNAGNGQRFGGVGQMIAIETKNGAAIFIRTYNNAASLQEEKAAAIAAGCTYYTNAADVVIDVNGRSTPNTFGRDIFWFQVGENGILYPYGGRDVDRLEGCGLWSAAAGDPVEGSQNGQAACTDNNKGNQAGERGIGCTARVIAEGYQMNY